MPWRNRKMWFREGSGRGVFNTTSYHIRQTWGTNQSAAPRVINAQNAFSRPRVKARCLPKMKMARRGRRSRIASPKARSLGPSFAKTEIRKYMARKRPAAVYQHVLRSMFMESQHCTEISFPVHNY